MNVSAQGVSKICRTCLVEITEDSDVFYLESVHSSNSVITLKDKLKTCFKEMNLRITPNAVICGDCYISVSFVYKFKKQCLQTEACINDYLLSINTNSSVGNLLHVAQQTKTRLSNHKDCNVIKLETSKNAEDGIDTVSMVDMSEISLNCISDLIIKDSMEIETDLPNTNEEIVDSTIIIYECHHCSYKTHYKPALGRHIHTSHSPIQTNSNKLLLQQCPACSYKIKVNKRKPFKCKKCLHSFVDLVNRKSHVSQNKLCNCTKCNYAASVRDLLKCRSADAYNRFQMFACKLFEEAYDVFQ